MLFESVRGPSTTVPPLTVPWDWDKAIASARITILPPPLSIAPALVKVLPGETAMSISPPLGGDAPGLYRHGAAGRRREPDSAVLRRYAVDADVGIIVAEQ